MRWSMLSLVACGDASPPPVHTPALMTTWAEPGGLYSIEVIGTPAPRDVQEITGVGTVNFKVYGFEDPPATYRVAAFAYPILEGSRLTFDAPGELAHAAGKLVARMHGTVTGEQPVVTEHQARVVGSDVAFSVNDDGHAGHGLVRTLVSPLPTALRFQAFCIVPADADLAPCDRFIHSLKPNIPVEPGPGTGPPKRPPVF